METRRDISVIVPVSRTQYLPETLQSVVEQTHQPHEIIVVDDGSKEDVASVVGRFGPRVRYYHQENRGTAAARNLGVEQARSALLAFLDDDDVWLPEKLSKQVRAFEERPDLDVVFGYAQNFYSPDVERGISANSKISTQPLPGYIPSAMMVKRASFLRVGFFETRWRFATWVEWYARAVRYQLSMHVVSEVLVRRRIHGANGQLREPETHDRELVHVLKASLDAQRRQQRGGVGDGSGRRRLAVEHENVT